MKGIILTVSGVSKDSVNKVIKAFEDVIFPDVEESGKINKETISKDQAEKDISDGLVVFYGTNSVEKIQCNEEDFLTFNVDVVDSKVENAETLSAIWRTCPTAFPRLVVNVDSKKAMIADVKNAVLEINKWVLDN